MAPVINLTDVQAVSVGDHHSMALTRNGDLFAWGQNSCGQLGDGTREDRSTPVAVQDLGDVISISAGGIHSMALTSNGNVFAWGYNCYVQLGDGSHTNWSTPVAVPGLEDVISISAGGSYNMALKSNGTVFTWGWNESGELGNGTWSEKRSTPEAVQDLKNVISISAGDHHSMALTSNGQVFAWGGNNDGQLGDGTHVPQLTPVAVPGLENVISISARGYYSMALTRDGKVFAWGSNRYGQLGDGTHENRSTPVAVPGLKDVISIFAECRHSMALTRDGKVFAWGYNGYGQLGDGTRENRSTPVAVQEDLEGVISISAGHDHSMALTSDGEVFAWGSNRYGHLGNGEVEESDHGEDSEEESDGEREEVCRYCNIPNTPEEMKWRIGQCRGENQCLISLDQLKNREAVYLISPSGGMFAYKTTAILKWLKTADTNPGSSEVIPNAREVAIVLEGIVQYQEDAR